MRVVSIASASGIAGRIVVKWRANIGFAPGGPSSSRLWSAHLHHVRLCIHALNWCRARRPLWHRNALCGDDFNAYGPAAMGFLMTVSGLGARSGKLFEERLGLLVSGDVEGLMKTGFSFRMMFCRARQQQLSLEADTTPPPTSVPPCCARPSAPRPAWQADVAGLALAPWSGWQLSPGVPGQCPLLSVSAGRVPSPAR